MINPMQLAGKEGVRAAQQLRGAVFQRAGNGTAVHMSSCRGSENVIPDETVHGPCGAVRGARRTRDDGLPGFSRLMGSGPASGASSRAAA